MANQSKSRGWASSQASRFFPKTKDARRLLRSMKGHAHRLSIEDNLSLSITWAGSYFELIAYVRSDDTWIDGAVEHKELTVKWLTDISGKGSAWREEQIL